MYRATSGSSSARDSIRLICNLVHIACIDLMSVPGVALNPTKRNFAPELLISRISTELACSPVARCASSITTHKIFDALHRSSVISLTNVCGVQKKTRLLVHITALFSGFVRPDISAV